jgi:hypothetical protein
MSHPFPLAPGGERTGATTPVETPAAPLPTLLYWTAGTQYALA